MCISLYCITAYIIAIYLSILINVRVNNPETLWDHFRLNHHSTPKVETFPGRVRIHGWICNAISSRVFVQIALTEIGLCKAQNLINDKGVHEWIRQEYMHRPLLNHQRSHEIRTTTLLNQINPKKWQRRQCTSGQSFVVGVLTHDWPSANIRSRACRSFTCTKAPHLQRRDKTPNEFLMGARVDRRRNSPIKFARFTEFFTVSSGEMIRNVLFYFGCV